MDDAFYVTLPSDGASKVYPTNRPTCYRTDLDMNKQLLSGWEVGLSQIQFTHDWSNSTPQYKFLAWILKSDIPPVAQDYPRGYAISALESRLLDIGRAQVTHTTESEGVVSVTNAKSRMVTVPPWHGFRHVEEFGAYVASYIETALDDTESHLYSVRYDRKSDTLAKFAVVEHTGGGNVYFGMSSEDDEMFATLGISSRRESERLENKKLKVYQFRERFTIPRNNGFNKPNTILVYTDICAEQPIGSVKGQMLKLIPVTSKRGERQCNEYDRPTYVPVVPTNLGNMEISLRDLPGKEIQAWDPNSLVTVVLHFRRRKGYVADSGWC